MRGSFGSLALRAANVGLGLGLAVILARSLGPKDYGVYAYVYALISLLSVPAQFGLPNLVVRETAKAEANKQWGLLRGLWRWAGFTATALSLLLALIGGGVAVVFASHFSALQLVTFAWGLALVPLVALGSLRGAALRGLRKVVQGQLPEQLIRPALLICFVAVAGLYLPSRIQADEAMALHVLAAGIAFVVGAWLLRRKRPAPLVFDRPAPVYDARRWFFSSLPLAFTAGMTLVNRQIDILMLGAFGAAHDVGVYRVASQGATLVSFGLGAIAMVTMPYFARYCQRRDMLLIQKLATVSARASLLLVVPVVLVFFLFGSNILSIVFGPEYASGYGVLVILSCAQCVNAGFGSVGPLLNMSGHERDTAKGVAVAAVCNVILNLVLIPLYGMIGAAFATGVTLLIWNVVLWQMVRRRLGVDTSAFGWFRG